MVAKAVIDALSRIEPTYRTAVELFYLSELSYKEIAALADVPIGTKIRSRKIVTNFLKE